MLSFGRDMILHAVGVLRRTCLLDGALGSAFVRATQR
jgi:hypothetical protein